MHFITEEYVPFVVKIVLMLDAEYVNVTIKDIQKERTKAAKSNQRKVPRRGR